MYLPDLQLEEQSLVHHLSIQPRLKFEQSPILSSSSWQRRFREMAEGYRFLARYLSLVQGRWMPMNQNQSKQTHL